MMMMKTLEFSVFVTTRRKREPKLGHESQDLFYNTQMSISPTSIASEKAFLAVGICITKLGTKPFFLKLL